jgi:hypothetical protein
LCSILLDETTSCSVTKELIIYLKIVVKGEAENVLLGLHQVRDGRSDTIMSSVKEVLRAKGLEADQIVGLGSDGASALMSE